METVSFHSIFFLSPGKFKLSEQQYNYSKQNLILLVNGYHSK